MKEIEIISSEAIKSLQEAADAAERLAKAMDNIAKYFKPNNDFGGEYRK